MIRSCEGPTRLRIANHRFFSKSLPRPTNLLPGEQSSAEVFERVSAGLRGHQGLTGLRHHMCPQVQVHNTQHQCQFNLRAYSLFRQLWQCFSTCSLTPTMYFSLRFSSGPKHADSCIRFGTTCEKNSATSKNTFPMTYHEKHTLFNTDTNPQKNYMSHAHMCWNGCAYSQCFGQVHLNFCLHKERAPNLKTHLCLILYCPQKRSGSRLNKAVCRLIRWRRKDNDTVQCGLRSCEVEKQVSWRQW